jgi:hypothetical protein
MKVWLLPRLKMANFEYLRIRPKSLPAGLFLLFLTQMATQTKPFPQKPTLRTNSAWRKQGPFSKNTKIKIGDFLRKNSGGW